VGLAQTPPIDITGIVIPVPEAKPYADHPHITLLAPFRSREQLFRTPLRDALERFFAPIAPLSFALVETRVFPDGHVYLAPEPDEPFRAMTLALAAIFPECPPYGGQFDTVIPHVTISEEVLPGALPISVYAEVAQLVHSHGESWDVIGVFDLGG
jgi:2'-5' RNA ligase superfamily